ncbi:RDD family protein [Streptomyces sp. ISL-98]|uniref:RDD family protein n=1 Tax=Streptomyces sp. ISL-98 TaxID=2819192 RepID=UPI001BE5666F|nr:RDD family protein [Streptomyces sp. ISL-98]MBT2509842.1 RDD family protein [Streptomyces sp. ISL-98]
MAPYPSPGSIGPGQSASQFGSAPAEFPAYPTAGLPVYPVNGPAPGVTVTANVGSRLGARVLDVVFWFAGYWVLALPLSLWIDLRGPEESGLPQALLIVWLLVSFTLYFPFSVCKFGMTLGKRICGVRIARCETGGRVGFWRAFMRELFWLVSIVIPVLCILNPLWCCWDKPFQQCLHDKVAGTRAVER